MDSDPRKRRTLQSLFPDDASVVDGHGKKASGRPRNPDHLEEVTQLPERPGARLLSRPQRGWAIGAGRCTVFETNDGAATWTPNCCAFKAHGESEFTNFGWITFAAKRSGIIAGWNVPPRRAAVPDWMDSEKAKNRRLLPSTSRPASD